MNPKPRISVCSLGEERLNGLGTMMLQYLEQNFADFEYKIKEGLRLRGCVAVEVDKGIATSIYFRGERIEIANGVSDHPDLYLKSSYLLLAAVLSGKANPYMELIRGKIKLKAWPKRPYQSYKILRFLKVPSELLQEKPSSR
jgi:putative sterol carrier protein